MAVVLAFISIKGGVGKTTLAIETASCLANYFGKRVLLVDANFSAPNVGLYLDLTNDLTLHDVLSGEGLHTAIYESHGFDVVPASLYYGKEIDIFSLKNVLSKIKDQYDFIILDSSPNYYELIPVIAAANKIFIVTTPDSVTLETTLKAAKLARQKKTPIEGVIVNKIKNPNYEADLLDIEEFFKIPVLAKIRDSKKLTEALFYKKPLTVHDKNHEISREIRKLSSALCGMPEEPESFFERLLSFRNMVERQKINREIVRQSFYQASFN
ncbi:MAG: AAA family ATPase [Nanoarchaeota archaeon]